jgi:hypothetical protein
MKLKAQQKVKLFSYWFDFIPIAVGRLTGHLSYEIYAVKNVFA